MIFTKTMYYLQFEAKKQELVKTYVTDKHKKTIKELGKRMDYDEEFTWSRFKVMEKQEDVRYIKELYETEKTLISAYSKVVAFLRKSGKDYKQWQDKWMESCRACYKYKLFLKKNGIAI